MEVAVENYIIKGETEGGGTKYDKKINNILYFVPHSSSKKKITFAPEYELNEKPEVFKCPIYLTTEEYILNIML